MLKGVWRPAGWPQDESEATESAWHAHLGGICQNYPLGLWVFPEKSPDLLSLGKEHGLEGDSKPGPQHSGRQVVERLAPSLSRPTLNVT